MSDRWVRNLILSNEGIFWNIFQHWNLLVRGHSKLILWLMDSLQPFHMFLLFNIKTHSTYFNPPNKNIKIKLPCSLLLTAPLKGCKKNTIHPFFCGPFGISLTAVHCNVNWSFSKYKIHSCILQVDTATFQKKNTRMWPCWIWHLQMKNAHLYWPSWIWHFF